MRTKNIHFLDYLKMFITSFVILITMMIPEIMEADMGIQITKYTKFKKSFIWLTYGTYGDHFNKSNITLLSNLMD